MPIPVTRFGDIDGQRVDRAVLTSDNGISVAVLSYGAILQDWRVSVDGAAPRSLVLNFDSMGGYRDRSHYFGAVVGRVANRVWNGTFELDHTVYVLPQNHGEHCLHGGTIGLARRLWQMETDSTQNAVRLTCRSPHGEDGFPGHVDFAVTYRLRGHTLEMAFEGLPDCPTPLNLTQHSYFNLGTGDDIRDTTIQLTADRYTPTTADMIPTGEILPVEGTAFDFRNGRRIDQPYDHNLVFPEERDNAAPVATVTAATSPLQLTLWTDRPALQLYNAAGTRVPAPGPDGRPYGNYCGFCLECQDFPDSLHQPGFPSIVHHPDLPYKQRTVVKIAPG
ncbi:MAG: aldose epimerase family protein [Magnetospiraceae bacterium]